MSRTQEYELSLAVAFSDLVMSSFPYTMDVTNVKKVDKYNMYIWTNNTQIRFLDPRNYYEN